MRDDRFVRLAKALADPTRRQMVETLRARGHLTCSDVCGCFKLSQPTISHHIRTLERAGAITVAEQGPFHVLSLNQAVLDEFADAVAGAARSKPAAPRARTRTRVRTRPA